MHPDDINKSDVKKEDAKLNNEEDLKDIRRFVEPANVITDKFGEREGSVYILDPNEKRWYKGSR